MSVTLILPVYNDLTELKSGINYFLNNKIIECEIIVVDDGSRYANQYKEICSTINAKYIRLEKNSGKGAAIKAGALASSSDYIIFTDSDFPYEYKDFQAILNKLQNENSDLVCGSRFSNRSYYSNISFLRGRLSKLFNFLVKQSIGTGTIDSQCGLKGFNKKTVIPLFYEQRIQRYCFDVEILAKAFKLNYQIDSVPVTIREMSPGSLRLYKDGWQMLRDLAKIFFWYRF